MKKGQNSLLRYLFLLLVILTCAGLQDGFAQKNTTYLLREQANRNYQNKNYAKAAELYQLLYKASGADAYFDYYLRSLIGMNDYRTAEKEVKRKLKQSDRPKYQVWLGYIYEQEGNIKRSNAIYQQAIDEVQPERTRIVELGNAFYMLGEMDWAVRVYKAAQKKFPAQEYNYELAQIYFITRNYSEMLDAYLDLLDSQPKALQTVEGRLMTAFYYDIDGELKKEMQKNILSRMQKHPSEVVYNKLYIWFLMQQKKYSMALSLALALDRRTGNEAETILNLARLASKGGVYAEAIKAYGYLKKRKGSSSYREEALLGETEAAYHHFLTDYPASKNASDSVEQFFQQTLARLGQDRRTLFLLEDYARFQAFYRHQPDKAIQLLKQADKIQGLNAAQRGAVSMELADCNVCAGDYWEAVILYARLASEMRETALADEAKFRRARLAYYMGEFDWVRAQMDVLKASTAKLTANDALELSLLISSHEAPDSTNSDLQMLARSDLDQFCNRMESALLRLDSLQHEYPSSDLIEDVLSRKAFILNKMRRFDAAASVWNDLLKRYPDGNRSDEARYRLGQLYEKQLNQPEKAIAVYRDIVLHHPGSLYIEEARKRFRELRENSQNLK